MAEAEEYYPPLSPTQTGFAGKCPRCGRGELFDGYLRLKDACPRCGLDYTQADSGDGPAFFIMSITGTIGVIVAMILALGLNAPAEVTVLITFTLIGVLTWALLRPAKGLLVALQYRNKAAEGRIE